jgi:hypothetical protein
MQQGQVLAVGVAVTDQHVEGRRFEQSLKLVRFA